MVVRGLYSSKLRAVLHPAKSLNAFERSVQYMLSSIFILYYNTEGINFKSIKELWPKSEPMLNGKMLKEVLDEY